MPSIPQDKYASLPTGDLVLFAVQHLHADGVSATTEEIVSACFKLFPHRFALKNYFYWPDSAHVVQALKYAKEKGYIKDSPADGLVLRPAGRRIARQSAKAMGIPFPSPPRAEKPKAAEIQPELESAVQPQPPKKAAAPPKMKRRVKKAEKNIERKTKPKPKRVKPAAKVAAKPILPVKKTVRKKTTAEKAVPSPKKKPAPKPKVQPGRKKAPVRRKEKMAAKPARKKPRAEKQLPSLAPAAPTKEAKKPVIGKKSVRRKIQAKVGGEAKPVPAEKGFAISKEEKVKAGKVVHQMERSDAYRQYKKLGRKAKISEFDFRNMLFATMESSAETLKRNVDLLRRYAGIHNRVDLITFLDFAEGSFESLLKPQARQPARKK